MELGKKKALVIHPSVVSEEINDEFVLLQLESGRFFHFNPAAREFFEFFKTPHTLNQYWDRFGVPEGEKSEITTLAERLLKANLMAQVSDTTPETATKGFYSRPHLLRESAKQYAEVVHLNPNVMGVSGH